MLFRSSPDLALAWRAFREHLASPVLDVRDYAMAEIGTYDFDFQPIRPALVVDLCRQFGRYEDGEFQGYEQLHLMLYYPAQAELESLRMSEFWEEGQPQTGFVGEVERQEAFLKARSLEFSSALLKQWEV